MNERFTELYKQAWGHFPCPTGEPELEKFAQLIVRECAEVAACNAHVSGFSLGDLMKQHFGLNSLEYTREEDEEWNNLDRKLNEST
jgi:hypothetical protein